MTHNVMLMTMRCRPNREDSRIYVYGTSAALDAYGHAYAAEIVWQGLLASNISHDAAQQLAENLAALDPQNARRRPECPVEAIGV